MRPLYLTEEKIGDKKFKITLSDKHQSWFDSDKPLNKPKEESTAFELTIEDGNLKKMEVAYNGVKKISLDFFDGPMGRAMNYHLLDEKLDLADQLRLGLVRYLEPGLHYLSRIVDDYTYPKIFHHYSDGSGVCMFYNPYNLEHPLTIGLSNPGASTEHTQYALFNYDEEGFMIDHPKNRTDLLDIKTQKTKKNQKTNTQKQDTLKMEKMAIFAELDRLTPSQQRDVLAVTRAKLDLYRSNYGKE